MFAKFCVSDGTQPSLIVMCYFTSLLKVQVIISYFLSSKAEIKLKGHALLLYGRTAMKFGENKNKFLI